MGKLPPTGGVRREGPWDRYSRYNPNNYYNIRNFRSDSDSGIWKVILPAAIIIVAGVVTKVIGLW